MVLHLYKSLSQNVGGFEKQYYFLGGDSPLSGVLYTGEVQHVTSLLSSSAVIQCVHELLFFLSQDFVTVELEKPWCRTPFPGIPIPASFCYDGFILPSYRGT